MANYYNDQNFQENLELNRELVAKLEDDQIDSDDESDNEIKELYELHSEFSSGEEEERSLHPNDVYFYQLPHNPTSTRTNRMYDTPNIAKASPIIQLSSNDSLPHNEAAASLYDNLDTSQVEALYISKCNQLKEREQRLDIFQQEQDKKMSVLRHTNKKLEEEKETLIYSLEQQQNRCIELMNKLKKHEAVKDTVHQLEGEREDLLVQLNSARSTIQSLNKELSDLKQTDSIQRLRLSYENALVKLEKEYEDKLNNLTEELSIARNELDKIKHQYEKCTSSTDISHRSMSVGTLTDFNNDDIERDKRQLIAQVEDLTSQLSSVNEKLILSEQSSIKSQDLLDEFKIERMKEIDQYKQRIDILQSDLDMHQAKADNQLKTSLEQCRLACLKLHEDSNKRLKEELLKEKNEQEQRYRIDMNKLRNENGSLSAKLNTTQQQLLEANNEKDELIIEASSMKRKIDELQRHSFSASSANNDDLKQDSDSKKYFDKEKWQRQIDIAISSAHKLWKKDEEARIDQSVLAAIEQVQEEHKKTLVKLRQDKEKESDQVKRLKIEKLKLGEELKETTDKLQEANVKTDNLKRALHELRNTLPTLQTKIVELMWSTLKIQDEWYTQQFNNNNNN